MMVVRRKRKKYINMRVKNSCTSKYKKTKYKMKNEKL